MSNVYYYNYKQVVPATPTLTSVRLSSVAVSPLMLPLYLYTDEPMPALDLLSLTEKVVDGLGVEISQKCKV